MSGKNREGYLDPTANTAVGRVTRTEKKKKKEAAKNVRISRKFKDGKEIQRAGNDV
ncbi:MAG: hypothetical protein Q4C77_08590 [Eubacteriales bacterium]|nr:hypothetical protein [Eubacteriales bacterium]